MRPYLPPVIGTNVVFQSTHLVWGATLKYRLRKKISVISIHAPRVRCDFRDFSGRPCRDISIHAPRVRCDETVSAPMFPREYFNPRTSCEVRPDDGMNGLIPTVFQSTHLVWGATVTIPRNKREEGISIHAPRVRCDASRPKERRPFCYFNPRTSCEVRLMGSDGTPRKIIFQSTHLVWGATSVGLAAYVRTCISIHAPRVRCDVKNNPNKYEQSHFNPRTSCEVRQTSPFRVN